MHRASIHWCIGEEVVIAAHIIIKTIANIRGAVGPGSGPVIVHHGIDFSGCLVLLCLYKAN